jgi:hypothetical protein
MPEKNVVNRCMVSERMKADRPRGTALVIFSKFQAFIISEGGTTCSLPKSLPSSTPIIVEGMFTRSMILSE